MKSNKQPRPVFIPAGRYGIIYNKKLMQWCVKFGRLTIFASDSYEIAHDFLLQHKADADSDRKAGDINA